MAEPQCWVGVLVRLRPGAGDEPPEARPVGRAALALRDEGIGVLFGQRLQQGRMDGFAARPGAWEERRDVAVAALHDRFPSQTYPRRYRQLLAGGRGLPLGNPTSITLLCRDKLECQRVLEGGGLAMPQVEEDARRFAGRLQGWGAAFLKPRYGALGCGVRLVAPGEALPAMGEGAVAGVREPLLLQRAVPPPAGWSGWSLRVLAQRVPGGQWVLASRVLRRSRRDPVVNVARGAEVLMAEGVLSEGALRRLDEVCLGVAGQLAGSPDGERIVELGVDAVVDTDGGVHVIEVNSRPRGRLEAMAEVDPGRYRAAHVEACARPLRYLSWLAGRG